MKNLIHDLTALGQSLWYDNIQRRLLENGELAALIERGDIRGVTSNPSIFHNAIAKTHDYDSALTPLALSGWNAEQIFWQLAIEDIRAACDLFQPLYAETEGADGYVSLEVSPYLANDTDATVDTGQASLADGQPPEPDDQDPRHQGRYSGHPSGDCRRDQRQRHADFLHRTLQGSHGRLHERP